MNDLPSNPWLVTIFGMIVVIITLAVLLYITKFVALIVRMGEKASGKKSPPNAAPAPREENDSSSHQTQSTISNPADNNIMAVIAAAVHSVLGSSASVLEVRESHSKQQNPWINASRWSQLQAQIKTFGRK